MSASNLEETKVIYHIDDEDTPYLIKLPVSSDKVTLGDFKNALNRPAYKFFFKSMDDDFGVVKEELIEDEARLPCFNGRVVSWLVTADSSTHSSDNQVPPSHNKQAPTGENKERSAAINNSRPPSYYAATTDQESVVYDPPTDTDTLLGNRKGPHVAMPRQPYNQRMNYDGASSIVTSDIESVSVIDTDDTQSRFSSVSGTTGASSMYARNRKKKFRHRMPPISQASSMSSITDSTMSLNVINVVLNMDTVNFLGISIVGQTNKGGDGGIYVGSIMKGGAVALDGRIEPGDMILEVNGVSFEDMSNDEAVHALRSAAQRPGPVTLVVAKCWDPNPKGYMMAPRQEPVRPIDPSAWVAHTEAVRAMYGRLGPPPSAIRTSSNGAVMSSIPECAAERAGSYSPTMSNTLNTSKSSDPGPLTISSDPQTIVRAMVQPDSGLEIRDRTWLKITIPKAFIGSDLVNWLHSNVEGFTDRREARKFACNLLKKGFIKHTVNKLSFSEQCYYTVVGIMPVAPPLPITTEEFEADGDGTELRIYDTLGPPSMPQATWGPFPQKPFNPAFPVASNISYIPPAPYNFINDAMSLDSLLIANGADTVKSSSESTGSGHSQVRSRGLMDKNVGMVRNPFLNPLSGTNPLISQSIASTASAVTTTTTLTSSASNASDDRSSSCQ